MTPLLADPASFAAPLSADAPAGPNLTGVLSAGDAATKTLSADFFRLAAEARGAPESKIPPNWPGVYANALNLARHTRDLRVAVWLARSATRVFGLQGALRGLQLVQALVGQLWHAVHPQVQAEDKETILDRLAALKPLWHPDGLPLDLSTSALVPDARGVPLTLREIQLALGKAKPHSDETALTKAGALSLLGKLLGGSPSLAEDIDVTLATARAVAGRAAAEAAAAKLGAGSVGDVAPLINILELANSAVSEVGGGPIPQASTNALNPNDASGDSPPYQPGADGGMIVSRDQVVKDLSRICEWVERAEPSNPAPLLIRRAIRVLNMDFMEIIREMAPGAEAEVRAIAGPQPDDEKE